VGLGLVKGQVVVGNVFWPNLRQLWVGAFVPLALRVASFVLSEVFWLMVLLVNVGRQLLVIVFGHTVRAVSLRAQLPGTLLDRHGLFVIVKVRVHARTVIVQIELVSTRVGVRSYSALADSSVFRFNPLSAVIGELSFVLRGEHCLSRRAGDTNIRQMVSNRRFKVGKGRRLLVFRNSMTQDFVAGHSSVMRRILAIAQILVFSFRLEQAEIPASGHGALVVEGTSLQKLFIRLRNEFCLQERCPCLVYFSMVFDVIGVSGGLLAFDFALPTPTVILRSLTGTSSSHMGASGEVNARNSLLQVLVDILLTVLFELSLKPDFINTSDCHILPTSMGRLNST